MKIPVCILQKDGKLTSTPRGRDILQNQVTANLTHLSCAGDKQVKAGSCLCGRLRRHISLICTWGLLFFCSPAAKAGIQILQGISQGGAGKHSHMLQLQMQSSTAYKQQKRIFEKFNLLNSSHIYLALPMQSYLSGTTFFLNIQILSNTAYGQRRHNSDRFRKMGKSESIQNQ